VVPSLCPVPANAVVFEEKNEDDPDDEPFKFNPFFNFSFSLSIAVSTFIISSSQ
jgi:hypothetical protein